MADEPFVDAHIHYWDKSVPDLGWAWLEPGYEFRKWVSDPALDAPRYSTPELLAEADGCGLVAAVHVHCADPVGDPRVETRWLQSVADDTGWPQGLVAACDLEDPDAPAQIADLATVANFRGVRDYLSPQRLDADDGRKALDALAALGSTLEIRRHHDELAPVDEIAARWPDLTIVLSHGCLPLERTEPERARWAAAMRNVARRENVYCKVSALVGASQPDWSDDTVRPWILDVVDAFGADRCLLGSNFPIDRPYCSYPDLIAAYRAAVSELSATERTAVLGGTARRLYRLDLGADGR